MSEPLFILGITPRSGSNLLRASLLLHPEVTQANVVGEDFILRYSSDLLAFEDKLKKSWSDLWSWGSTTKEDQKDRLNDSLRNGLLTYLKPVSNSRYFLTTTPYTIGAENIDMLFPEAKLILLTREGQDAVESGVLGKFWSYHEGYELWSQSASRILKLKERSQTLVVKYEDLIHNRDNTIHVVMNFLGFDATSFPYESLNELPVFGSSTHKVEGEFKYEITDKPKDFKPTKRSENWSNYRHYAFNRRCGKLQRALEYSIKETAANPIFSIRFLIENLNFKWSKFSRTMIKLKRQFPIEFNAMIKAK